MQVRKYILRYNVDASDEKVEETDDESRSYINLCEYDRHRVSFPAFNIQSNDHKNCYSVIFVSRITSAFISI